MTVWFYKLKKSCNLYDQSCKVSFRLSAPIIEQNRSIEFEGSNTLAAATSQLQSTGSFQSLNLKEAETLFSSPRLPSPLAIKPAFSITLASLFLSCLLLFLWGVLSLEILFVLVWGLIDVVYWIYANISLQLSSEWRYWFYSFSLVCRWSLWAILPHIRLLISSTVTTVAYFADSILIYK